MARLRLSKVVWYEVAPARRQLRVAFNFCTQLVDEVKRPSLQLHTVTTGHAYRSCDKSLLRPPHICGQKYRSDMKLMGF